MINLQDIAKILLEREGLLKNITPRLLQRHLNEVDLSLRAQIQSIEEQKIALKKEREKLNSFKSKINEESSDNIPSSSNDTVTKIDPESDQFTSPVSSKKLNEQELRDLRARIDKLAK